MSEAQKDEQQAGAEAASPQEDASKGVKCGGKIIAVVILASLVWYLASDRYTPYTSQARVQGYVIGVAPQVSGIVTEVLVDTNERVEADQPLFRIDSSQYEIALAKAQSDYENAVRQVQAGDAGVEAARANLRAALANLDKAQKDTDRLERLYMEDPGTISVRRLEVSRATLDPCKAAVVAAEASIEQAIEAQGGDSREDNAILKIARAGVEKAQLDLEHTVVRATDRGEITNLDVDVGAFAGAGHPVMTLISLSDVWIQAEFTENNLGHMEAGTPVEILFDSLPGEVFKGTVGNIGLGIQASRPAQPGSLPSVDNNRDWLRQAQRFPVIVRFDPGQDDVLLDNLRIGGQSAVIAYTEPAWLTRMLGRLYVRIMTYLSYAY